MVRSSALVFSSDPSSELSRAQAAELLYEVEGRSAPGGASPFEDTPERYADAIAWASENGIIDGVSDTSYDPSLSVACEEFAAILYRTAASSDARTSALGGFADAGAVSTGPATR